MEQGKNINGPAVSAPEVSLPKGGSINGYGETFQPNTFTGAAALNISLFVSQGRGQPDSLALTYSSGSGNGPFGQGFSLSLPFISTRTEKGIPRYDGTDLYMLSGGGELVPRYNKDGDEWKLDERRELIDDQPYQVIVYRPRIEQGFLKIEHWTNLDTRVSFWRITDKENRVAVYGQGDNARIFDPANSTHVFRWLIESTTDAHGNKTLYFYKQENDENVPPEVFNEGHTNTANKYIERILYGNYQGENGSERFAFEIIFDYGEYVLDPPMLHPVQPWACRKDIFSSFRAGFEIRTYRLCQSILMVHHFPDELGVDACLVNVMRFEYLSSPIYSFLVSAQRVGYRLQEDGQYWRQEMPKLELKYTEWHPERQDFGSLKVYGGGNFPGPFAPASYQLVDIYGEGLPGVLYTATGSMIYWPPRGGGEYEPPWNIPVFPIEDEFSNPSYVLLDVEGNGSRDLVVAQADRGGFYANNGGNWGVYRDFPSYTPEFVSGATQFVDINGDGLTDLFIPSGSYLRYYLSRRDLGFGPPTNKLKASSFPSSDAESEEIITTFADMFGDGLSHRVVIRSGNVEVWPNLGYGVFGPKITMGNAPQFGPSLRTSRILLADLNGSGRASLLFVYQDHIDVFVNESGNSFGDPIRIDLPFSFSDVDQALTADVLGTGLASLVITKSGQPVQHFYYDFCGDSRPYLLDSFSNNMGARAKITYKSSTSYYLADRNGDRPWVTRLPFPVDVVAKVETVDEVSGDSLVRVFQYSDGYFDTIDREFRGFGYCQSQDTETFATSVWRFPTLTEPPEGVPVAPEFTKTWMHTGAYLLNNVISKQFQQEYYHGDPYALDLPDSHFSPDILAGGSEILRQAYNALHGRQIRTETYGVEESGSVQSNPYVINEENYSVTLLQPPIEGHYAVFHVATRETATSRYECKSDNPRIEHQFDLLLDHYGNVLRSAVAYYPPRIDQGVADQMGLKAIAIESQYINKDESFYIIGLEYARQSYEIGNLSTGQNLYFTFDQISALVAEALGNVIPYGTSFTPGEVQARPYDMWRSYFWNAALTSALPLDDVSAQSLLHHTETAVFSQSLAEAVFGSKFPPPLLHQVLQDQLKYVLDEQYWWTPQSVEYYENASGYFLTSAVTDPFGNTTSVSYDNYWLEVATTENALEQTVLVQSDYQAMQPRSILDVNQNTSEVLFDPLGEVIVTSIYKMKDGVIVAGNMNLADYEIIPHPTMNEVLDDPAQFLQGASSYFFYDLKPWNPQSRQPMSSILLERRKYVYGPSGTGTPTAPEGEISVAINYIDGLTRQLCKKVKVEAEATPLPVTGYVWVTTDRVVYNQRSEPVKRYLAYFTESPDFDYNPTAPFITYFYDSLHREIITITPKGFHTKTVYDSWTKVYFDEDDTDLSSPFHDTPTTWAINSQGYVVQETKTNTITDGVIVEKQFLHSAYWRDIVGNMMQVVDPRFYNDQDPDHPSHFNFTYVFDMVSTTLSVLSADAGQKLLLNDAMEMPVHYWDAAGYHRETAYDALLRPVSLHVEGNGLNQLTWLAAYGSDPDHNNCDQVSQENDTAGIAYYTDYDIQGNLTYVERKILEDYRSVVNWNDPPTVRLMPEAWSISREYDSANIMTREVNADGSIYIPGTFLNAWIKSVSVKFPEAQDFQLIVGSLTYNAEGQRLTASYADGSTPGQGFALTTQYVYDGQDYRLQSIQTTRVSDSFKLQDLHYFYDPIGNVTRIEDYAQIIAIESGQQELINDYTYDAIYQLKVATGYQQSATGPNTRSCKLQPQPMSQTDSPNAAGPVIDGYTEQYNYDLSGNLTDLSHIASNPVENWSTRIAVSDTSNHAVPYDILGGKTPDDFFTPNGNQNGLTVQNTLQWDYANRLTNANFIVTSPGPSANSYFLYANTGTRMREVVERYIDGALAETVDTLYIGNLVAAKTVTAAGGENSSEVYSLRVMDANRCCLVTSIDQTGAGQPAGAGARTYRYQLDNSLGSVIVEVDQVGQVLTYEQYFPYGCPSILTGSGESTIEQKRYRYNGKELDASTGLYYYGQRYYAPWQFRWLSPDPAGTADGLNLYEYVGGNPITFNDEHGLCKDQPKKPAKSKYDPKVIQATAVVAAASVGAVVLAALFPSQTVRIALRSNVIKNKVPAWMSNPKVLEKGWSYIFTSYYTHWGRQWVPRYRGVVSKSDIELLEKGILQSPAMRVGRQGEAGVGLKGFLERFWHPITSHLPPSFWVSTTNKEHIAQAFAQRYSGGTTYKFLIQRMSIYRSWVPGEGEYLARGRTQVRNVEKRPVDIEAVLKAKQKREEPPWE